MQLCGGRSGALCALLVLAFACCLSKVGFPHSKKKLLRHYVRSSLKLTIQHADPFNLVFVKMLYSLALNKDFIA